MDISSCKFNVELFAYLQEDYVRDFVLTNNMYNLRNNFYLTNFVRSKFNSSRIILIIIYFFSPTFIFFFQVM